MQSTPRDHAQAVGYDNHTCATLSVMIKQGCTAIMFVQRYRNSHACASPCNSQACLRFYGNCAGMALSEISSMQHSCLLQRKKWHPLFPTGDIGLSTIFWNLRAARRSDSDSLPKRAGSCHDCDFPGQPLLLRNLSIGLVTLALSNPNSLSHITTMTATPSDPFIYVPQHAQVVTVAFHHLCCLPHAAVYKWTQEHYTPLSVRQASLH